jgi:endoglucanase
MIRHIRILSLLTCLLLLTSCIGGGTTSLGGVENRLTLAEYRVADFSVGSTDGFWARNDRGNGHPFNCAFHNDHALLNDGRLTLVLSKSQTGYVGAEYRSRQKFSYGFYSVKMKAAKCPGVISSFFTYTGFPWDEIDIEFLGDDTTRVQFNYYTNGIGHHEYVYHLGFDASEDFHEYAFDWQPDSITWYVDGKPVYRATANIPSTPGQIMVNLWNVADSNADWAGKFDDSYLPLTAEYLWFGYQPAD